jgi:hypothetical protein
MSVCWKKLLSFWYSPPQSHWTAEFSYQRVFLLDSKILEISENLIFVLKQEYPSEFYIIINEGNIVFISPNGITSRSLYITTY